MKQITFVLFITVFFTYFSSVSCDKESNDILIVEEEIDSIPVDTTTKILGIYIETQDDFDRFNNLNYLPGANIFFAAGKSFNGQFAPKGSGTESKPINVTSYNPDTKEIYWEDNDNKAIINGHGIVNSVFFLYNADNWIISNLEITNTDGSDADQGDLRGIHVVQEDVGVAKNITIRNCYVHNVNGKVEGKQRGGIHVHVEGSSVPTVINNVLIENNLISTVGGVGIGNSSSWGGIQDDDYQPWENYVVRNNRVEYSGRNGIIVRFGTNPIAEYNIIAHASRYSTGHSIFNFNTRGCVVQFNEAYGNTGNIDDIDRGGFDADYNSENTTFQYNYSHNNHWFCGIMRKYNKGVTIRYNISVNDKLGAYEYGFPTDVGLEDCLIYNNTHYFGAEFNASPFASPSKTRIPINTSLYNNIFYFEKASTWRVVPDNSCDLSHNIYHNIAVWGANSLTGDPLFLNKGEVPVDVDMTDPERLAGYRLGDISPCIDAGKVIENNGGIDFWGNPLSDGKPDIGAYEKQN
ncbi:MAG: right-handed parallel beta-helix repeat-containing protein [Bacteroidales bacterium]|nr:right-handed parallel beta-helix repeat-containing protein [Bacteroidales bacterium]